MNSEYASNNNEVTIESPARGIFSLTEKSTGNKKKVFSGNVVAIYFGKGEYADIVTNVELRILDYNASTGRTEPRNVVVAFWNNNGAALSDWARELKIGAAITVTATDKEDGTSPRVDRLIKRNGLAQLDGGNYNIIAGYVFEPKEMQTRAKDTYLHIGITFPNNEWHNISFFKKDIDERTYNSIRTKLSPTIDKDGNKKHVKAVFFCGKQSSFTTASGKTAYSYRGFQYEVVPDDIDMSGNKNAETSTASYNKNKEETSKVTYLPENSKPEELKTAPNAGVKPTNVASVTSENSKGNTLIKIGMFREKPEHLIDIVARNNAREIKWLIFVATQMPVAKDNEEMNQLKDDIKEYLISKALLK